MFLLWIVVMLLRTATTTTTIAEDDEQQQQCISTTLDDDDDQMMTDNDNIRNSYPPPVIFIMGTSQVIVERDLPVTRDGIVHVAAMKNMTVAIHVIQSVQNLLPTLQIHPRHPIIVLCLSLTPCIPSEDSLLLSRLYDIGVRQYGRIPNLRDVLWSKKSFCTNVPGWVLSLYSSFPCFILPSQAQDFIQVYGKTHNTSWIFKPYSNGGGNGIFVLHPPTPPTADQLAQRLVVSPFFSYPLLFANNRKWDLRVYVLVTETFPLRAYRHERAIMRFASSLYSPDTASSLITNTALHKRHLPLHSLIQAVDYLYAQLGQQQAQKFRLELDFAIALILLSVENKLTQCRDEIGIRCHHLLGIDVLVTANDLHPRIVEVNGEPSLAAGSGVSYYDETKHIVTRHVADLVIGRHHQTPRHDWWQHFMDEMAAISRDNEFRPIYPSPIFDSRAMNGEMRDTWARRAISSSSSDQHRQTFHNDSIAMLFNYTRRRSKRKPWVGLENVLYDLQT